jgi:hypothetical protein
MAITNDQAIAMLALALKAGRTITIARYAGRGVLTVGPWRPAQGGPQDRFAAHFWASSWPGGQKGAYDRENETAEDIARFAVAHCGRANVRRALQGPKP